MMRIDYDKEPNPIVIGCNYHTTWQSVPSMRFVLNAIRGMKAQLITRTTGKSFWTNISDLIFIRTSHNHNKAIEIRNKNKQNGRTSNSTV